MQTTDILVSLYSEYIANGEFPNYSAFRRRCSPDEIRRLDQLASQGIVENRDGYYWFDFIPFLTETSEGKRDAEAINKLHKVFEHLFLSNDDGKRFTIDDVISAAYRFELLGIRKSTVERVCAYLSHFGCIGTMSRPHERIQEFQILETIRTRRSAEEMIEWRRSLTRHGLPKNDALSSLLEPQPRQPNLNISFVENSTLRAIIETDYQELQRAKDSHSWKSAMVFSGAIIEGILFGALTTAAEKSDRIRALVESNGKPLDRWLIGDLISVGRQGGMLSAGVEKHSIHVNEFRRLIHPARMLRESDFKIDEHEARVAFACIDMVVRDCAAFFASSK